MMILSIVIMIPAEADNKYAGRRRSESENIIM